MPSPPPFLRLKPEIQFNTPFSRHNLTFIAEDVLSHKYWRMGPLEYELCALLDGTIPLPECIASAKLKSRRIASATPERLQQALVWLLKSGIVEPVNAKNTVDFAEDTQTLSSRGKTFDPSFFRVRLFDESQIEKVVRPLTGLLSLPVAIIALAIWGIALVHLFSSSSDLARLSFQLFVPGQEWWFLVAWILLKFVHELGHAVACARVGATSNSAGIGFLFFAPTPFVNVTSLWRIGNRWGRILVSGAGMIFEITIAAIAVIVACNVQSPSVQSLCVSIMTLGTISTLVFNANPLMRFDGYYILIDLIGRPNLWQDAQAAVKGTLMRILQEPENIHIQSPGLILYGLASWVWRGLTLTAMAWGLWVAWDGIGLIIVMAFSVLWFGVPLIKGKWNPLSLLDATTIKDVLSFMTTKRWRNGLLLMAIVIAVGFLPSPVQVYWPGYVDFVDPVELRSDVSGIVSEVMAHDGDRVSAGQVLLRIENPEVLLEYDTAQKHLTSIEQRCHLLRAQKKAYELQAEEAQLAAMQYKLESLKQKVDALAVLSPREGVLILRGSRNMPGVFVDEGKYLGLVVDPEALEVKASLPQDAWESVAGSTGTDATLFVTQRNRWEGSLVQVLPRSSESLLTPSLGSNFGGPLAVLPSTNEEGQSELRTLKPRLLARLAIHRKIPGWISFSSGENDEMPQPGSVCSVRLHRNWDTIWGSLGRWGKAVLSVRFKKNSDDGR